MFIVVVLHISVYKKRWVSDLSIDINLNPWNPNHSILSLVNKQVPVVDGVGHGDPNGILQ